MVEIDATPGGLLSNSYVTLQDAWTFLQERLHIEPWTGTEADTQTLAELPGRRRAALITATRLLDEQINWFGQPLTRTQALAWPQTGQIDQYGRVVPQTTIPLVIQRATAFYALALLRDVSEEVAASADAYVKSKKIGEMTIVFRDQGLPIAPMAVIPSEIRHMLRFYGKITGGAMVPLLRT